MLVPLLAGEQQCATAAGAEMDTSSSASGPGSGWWYVSNGERKGPVNDQKLQHLLVSGTLRPNSLVWKQGMESWQPVAQVQALAPLLASLPPALPPELGEEPPEKAGSAAPEPRSAVQTRAERSAPAHGSMPVPQARSGSKSLRELTAPSAWAGLRRCLRPQSCLPHCLPQPDRLYRPLRLSPWKEWRARKDSNL